MDRASMPVLGARSVGSASLPSACSIRTLSCTCFATLFICNICKAEEPVSAADTRGMKSCQAVSQLCHNKPVAICNTKKHPRFLVVSAMS